MRFTDRMVLCGAAFMLSGNALDEASSSQVEWKFWLYTAGALYWGVIAVLQVWVLWRGD